jgi:hypothetical protein
MALSSESHGVIVTHGIGDNLKAGHLLADFTNNLCDGLLESPLIKSPKAKIYPAIQREAGLYEDPPSVTLQIESPRGEKTTWVCKEAFWGDAFPPPKAAAVLWWLLTKNLGNQLNYAFQGIAKDPNNSKTFITEKDKEAEKKKHPGELERIEEETRKTARNRLRAKSTSTLLLIPILTVITYLVLALIWVCQYLPSIGPLEKVLKWVHKLDPFLSESLGDVKMYVEHGVWSANARARLEKVIIDMLNDRFGKVKDITIVAHSMGCVVAYDALAEGGKVAEAVERLNYRGKTKKITLISVGSGINQVFGLAKNSNLYAQQQFKRPLAKAITGFSGVNDEKLTEKFFWIDIYARRDPVPAGDLDDEIIKQARVGKDQVKRRKVINTDNIMMDHSAYWANKDVVTPRIARAINGGKEYPWPEAGITKEKLDHRARYATQLDRLTKIAIVAVVVAAAVFLGLKLAGVV